MGYQICIIKSDFEGWFLFDDWKDYIIHSTDVISDIGKFIDVYQTLYRQYSKCRNQIKIGDYDILAMSNPKEVTYCESCEEDLQIYYSFIILKDNHVCNSPVNLSGII